METLIQQNTQKLNMNWWNVLSFLTTETSYKNCITSLFDSNLAYMLLPFNMCGAVLVVIDGSQWMTMPDRHIESPTQMLVSKLSYLGSNI